MLRFVKPGGPQFQFHSLTDDGVLGVRACTPEIRVLSPYVLALTVRVDLRINKLENPAYDSLVRFVGLLVLLTNHWS